MNSLSVAIILAIPLMTLLTPVLASAASAISVTEFTVTPTQQAFSVAISAQSSGANIGSFGLRTISRVDKTQIPAGFFLHANGYAYLGSSDFTAPENLKDNGSKDENPSTGTFSTTISTAGWPDGKYTFLIYAHNRPATGTYLIDSRPFVVQVQAGQVVKAQPIVATPLKDRVDVVVYKHEGIYAAFPSLALQPDGSLWMNVNTRTRRSHMDSTGGNITQVSQDGGLTWEKTDQPFVDPKWIEKRSANTYLVRPVAEGWVEVDQSRELELRTAGYFVNPVRPGTIAYLGSKAFSEVSVNGGRSWTHSEIATLPIASFGMMNYNQEASYIVTSKGTRLAAIYGRRSSKEPYEVFAVRSTDGGLNWSFQPLAGPLPTGVGLNETALVETVDGDILALMRNDPESYMYLSRSGDDGVTWSQPEKTPMLGHPAHLLRLKNGDILATYGYRISPMGIRATVSHDGGKTWDVDNEIILRADARDAGSDVGYPITVELEDGTLFTIYYISLADGITHVAATRWRLP